MNIEACFMVLLNAFILGIIIFLSIWLIYMIYTENIRRKNRVPNFYNMGGGWGDRIEWLSNGKGIIGWKQNLPDDGDILRAKMKDGSVGNYVMSNVRREGSVHDLFFADVTFKGIESPKKSLTSHE